MDNKSVIIIGAGVTGGGLPPAAMMGRDIIRRLCKLDSKKFQIT